MSDTAHQDLILDQFTRQATPFSTADTITDANALRMIVAAATPGPGDTVLDVACGGGIIVCAFAPEVKHATGIDMTPAMLDRARQLAAEKGLANVSWDQGDVGSLPYADGAFDIVVTRFSMHHFLDPIGMLREMVRVCAPGGRVVVVDMYTSEESGQGDRMEPAGEAARSVACAVSDFQRVASRRFSSTVSSSMMPRPSGTCATPRRAIITTGRPQELLARLEADRSRIACRPGH